MSEELQKERIKRFKQIRKKKDRRKVLVSAVLTLVLLALLGSLAWYIISSRRDIYSKNQEVMVPYFLYLKNATDENSLNFSVGNLHPGQTISQVICVTNQIPADEVGSNSYDISRASKFSYELELAYTENLPVEYKVYELQLDTDEDYDGDVVVSYEENEQTKQKYFSKVSGTPMAYSDTTSTNQKEVFGNADLSNVINKGIYHSYKKGGTTGQDDLTLTTSLDTNNNVVYDKDFYLIEISWKENIDFSKYTKETDLVEVIVKALQPRPEIEGSTAGNAE